MAVFAPMPSVSVRTATRVKTGCLRSDTKGVAQVLHGRLDGCAPSKGWAECGNRRTQGHADEHVRQLEDRDGLGDERDAPLADRVADRGRVPRRVDERIRAPELTEVVQIGVPHDRLAVRPGPTGGARVEVDAARPEVAPLDRVEQIRVRLELAARGSCGPGSTDAARSPARRSAPSAAPRRRASAPTRPPMPGS